MQTFNPPVDPTPDISHELEPRVLVAGFGDGYSQRAADGLNPLRQRYGSLQWDNLSQAEADAITGFFTARRGVEAFFWTPPDTGVTAKYRAVRWGRSRRTAQAFVVTASLVQEFDL
jgi:phage-related protein